MCLKLIAIVLVGNLLFSSTSWADVLPVGSAARAATFESRPGTTEAMLSEALVNDALPYLSPFSKASRSSFNRSASVCLSLRAV